MILLFALIVWMNRQAVAQDANWEIVINYVEANETPPDEPLELNLYFTVVDENGRVVPNANFDYAGTVQVVAGDNYEAEIEKAETPFYVALVLDASGSMGRSVPNLRQAAIQAIENAPEQAFFAVYQFNEATNGQILQLLQDFTLDRELITAAINRFQSADLGTCIYDAAYEAIQAVGNFTQSKPQVRRAVILFTDGYDEKHTGQRDTCSTHTVDQVISLAKSAPTTPIYTIGMSGDNPVDEITLRHIASDSSGLSAIGSQANLADMFRQIMDGLANQWQAHVSVRVPQGSHEALLTVTRQATALQPEHLLSATFSFESMIERGLDEVPVIKRIDVIGCQEGSPDCFFEVMLTNPQGIGRIQLFILNNAGYKIDEINSPVNPNNTVLIVPFDSFKDDGLCQVDGDTFTVDGYAFALDGGPITGKDQDEGQPLKSGSFDCNSPLPTPTPGVPTIDNVDIGAPREVMTITLRAQNDDAIRGYQVWLDIAGDTVAHFPNETISRTNQLVIPLTDLTECGEYKVSVQAIGESGIPLGDVVEYKDLRYYCPPEPVSKWYIVPLLALAIVVFTGVIWIFRVRDKQTEIEPVPPPPSIPVTPPAPEQTRIRIQIIKTRDKSQLTGRLIEVRPSQLPFKIGRGPKVHLEIDDENVSRHHAEITVNDRGQPGVTDTGSSNGTFVEIENEDINERIATKAFYPLQKGKTQLRLGDATYLLLERLW
jgi:VWFA-related protein